LQLKDFDKSYTFGEYKKLLKIKPDILEAIPPELIKMLYKNEDSSKFKVCCNETIE